MDQLLLKSAYTADGDLPHEYQLRRQPLVLDTETVRTVLVNRGRGWGCGNPLKGWLPLGPYTGAG